MMCNTRPTDPEALPALSALHRYLCELPLPWTSTMEALKPWSRFALVGLTMDMGGIPNCTLFIVHQPIRLWSKVAHYVENSVPFWMHPWSVSLRVMLCLWKISTTLEQYGSGAVATTLDSITGNRSQTTVKQTYIRGERGGSYGY